MAFVIPGISAYAALLYAPFFLKTLWSLRASFSLFNFILYLAAPICWQMSAQWRKYYLFVWVSFTLVGRILSSQIPIGTQDTLFDSVLFLTGLLMDGLVLTGSLLAIRAKESTLSWNTIAFVLIAILPAAGIYVAVTIWSDHIAATVFANAEKLAQSQPYCIASNKRKAENLSQLAGVSLLRARYDIGPGSGFSFMNYSRFYTVLAIQTGDKEQYWNWSFKQGSFVRDANTPEVRLRVNACNAITRVKYHYSEF